MFGPSRNVEAVLSMNQMFDFYDGGGLDITFLGAAEVSENGDVNASRMGKNRFTGPGEYFFAFNQCLQTKSVMVAKSPVISTLSRILLPRWVH